MTIKAIQFLLNLETGLCVYRNYSAFSRPQRILSWLRIVVEIVLISLIIYSKIFFYFNNRQDRYGMYTIINVINSISMIILTLYHSKTYHTLLVIIGNNNSYFTKDDDYGKGLNRLHKSTKFRTIFFFISISLPIFLHSISSYNNVGLLNIVYAITKVMFYLRYVTMYFMISLLLYILSEQIHTITRRISKERGIPVSAMDEEGIFFEQEITSFEEWTRIYMNIKTCSDLINSIFGLQITIFLASTMCLFIFSLYGVTYCSVQGYFLSLFTLREVIKMTIYAVCIYKLSRSAQSAQNSVEELRRRLGRLLIRTVTTDMEEHKATRNFLRLLSNLPIKTQAYGSIVINMTLVPTFITVFTSYTVMALQINNVV